jgi:hypothetical protein
MYLTFNEAIRFLHKEMKECAVAVHTESWQSMDISKRPEAEMRELLGIFFKVKMSDDYLDAYRRDIKPNLPWADHHFEQERVSGQPINPGETWKEWPYALSADKFRRAGECFSHTYAERMWPKYAGVCPTDTVKDEPLRGIRYEYGDLNDVVTLLIREPLTRQAYLPIFFPEDTGVVHRERVPCTLGYHFMRRNGELSIFYPIRSCDFVRHFRDDLYLTVRLLLWVLGELRERDLSAWGKVRPGIFSMWIGSLHCFINDWRQL